VSLSREIEASPDAFVWKIAAGSSEGIRFPVTIGEAPSGSRESVPLQHQLTARDSYLLSIRGGEAFQLQRTFRLERLQQDIVLNGEGAYRSPARFEQDCKDFEESNPTAEAIQGFFLVPVGVLGVFAIVFFAWVSWGRRRRPTPRPSDSTR
jgi:hypothetical protein